MIHNILFDLDGTLTDPREGITKSVQYALSKMGIEEPDLGSLEHFIGPPLYDEFRACYGFSDEDAKMAVKFYRERFSVVGWRENLLLDGISGLLADLQGAGLCLALASSKPKVFCERILTMFELGQYMSFVSGAELDGRRGTKVEVVQYAIEQLGITDLNDVVLVGDRLHDVEGAHAAGIRCVGVTFGFGGREELENAGSDWIVDTVDELRALLLEG